jgi:hypothetical protein
VKTQVFTVACAIGWIKYGMRLWLTLQSYANAGGPGSTVGTATRYGLDGLGFEPRWRRDFQKLSRTFPRPIQTPVQELLRNVCGEASWEAATEGDMPYVLDVTDPGR